MAIDFTFPPEIEEIRHKVRSFVSEVVKPIEEKAAVDDWAPRRLDQGHHRDAGPGQGVGPLAAPHAEGVGRHGPRPRRPWRASRPRPAGAAWAPSSSTPRPPTRATCTRCCTGRTDEQKEKYLRPLCEGTAASLLRHDRARGRRLRPDAHPDPGRTRTATSGSSTGTSGSSPAPSGAQFAILIARTEDDPDLPQAANSALHRRHARPRAGTIVRDVETMSRQPQPLRDRASSDLRVHEDQMLGGRGQGHLLGQYRLGPARLAHCMRWIGQAETALDMMVDRSLNRYAHGSLPGREAGHPVDDRRLRHGAVPGQADGAARGLPDRQRAWTSSPRCRWPSTSWPTAGPDHRPGDPGPRRPRLLDGHAAGRACAKQARWARFADGADEIHQMRIAQRTIAAWKDHGTIRNATGKLPL